MNTKNILLALEGTASETPVIRQAMDMARFLNTGLTVLHVNSPLAGRISMRMEPEPLLTEQDIRDLFRSLGYEDEADRLDVRIVTSPAVSREIVRAAADALLVIVGRSRRNRLAAALTETIDKHLPDRLPCPVMYVQKAGAGTRLPLHEQVTPGTPVGLN
ncbi:MAG: hypothetical protein KatS3mg042_1535 [Rhodothermaceae bacterium]|nr:MAG: hypothetical protein KatS3mg042_1535 [Rhodothermaceae bacterium]